MPNVHERLARNIRRIAAAKKIPLTHLADRAAVSRAELFNVLSGKKSPTVKWLALVSEALEVDIAGLFTP